MPDEDRATVVRDYRPEDREALYDVCVRTGPAVHLGVSVTNTGARAFYDRLGFTELSVPSEPATVVHLGLEL